MAEDGWTDDASSLGVLSDDGLVHSRKSLAWAATGLCAVSALFIPLGQLWAGYGTGVVASVVCMLAILDDRERQNNKNFVQGEGFPVEQRARLVRVASFLVCLVHIVRLAQEAAK